MLDNKTPTVCVTCFNNIHKPLKFCIILTTGYNKSNCENHLDTTHPDLFLLLKKDDIVKVKPSFQQKNQQTLLNMSSTSSTVGKTKSNASNESAKYKEIMTSERVLEKIKRLLYLFFNSCNIAIRQSRNVHLKDLLQELVMHGSLLKNVSNKIFFTRYSYKKEEKQMFSNIARSEYQRYVLRRQQSHTQFVVAR